MHTVEKSFFILLSILVCSLQINALDTTDFNDADLQKRYQTLNNELRCLVCQNETIAASSSELAQDLRKQVADQLRAGQSDEQIRTYMSERYGDFIHYRPLNTGRTRLLWLAPLILLLLFGLVFVTILAKKSKAVIEDDEVIE